MNKIDLIIDALEMAEDKVESAYVAIHIDKALAAARELKALQPVVYQKRMKADWVANWQEWVNCTKSVANDYINTPRLNDWTFEVRKLYALDEVTE